MSERTRRLVALTLVVATTTAAADTPAPAPESPPPTTSGDDIPAWAKDVPQEIRTQANDLYEAGNDYFGKQAHALALEKYKAALKLWDHPLIRFNAAVTEIRLDKVLDAAEDLDQALRFGDKPFKPELYQQALDYQALIKGRVGYIEGSCTQSDAHLQLDGKPWVDCPGTKSTRVLVGEHTIVGEKKNYLTISKKIELRADSKVTEKVTFVPLESAIILKYPFRKWIPWTTLGAGVGIALIGVGTYYTGKSDLDQFMADYARDCVNGCEEGLTSPNHSLLRNERSRALFKGDLGIGLMISGGAVALGGAVFVLLNRPKRLLPGGLEVMPTAGGGAASYTLSF
jgi:hypothetical protein